MVGDDGIQPRPGPLPDRRDDGGARGGVCGAVVGTNGGRGGDRPLGLVRRLGGQVCAGAWVFQPGREIMEARAAEFAELSSGRTEVEEAIDRWVWYAGWADKYAQVLGSSNPVAVPYFNFTIPEPTGVVGVLAPPTPALGGIVSRLAPVIVGGNTAVVLASEPEPLASIELAEAIATADVPGGVVNILTGQRSELAPWLAGHMDVNALDLSGGDGDLPELERLAAENVKRVVRGRSDRQSPYEIAAFQELKTVWHPIGV